jgi:regulator of protease activity HflC (stomatin/prohibitin superfamily)
VTPTNVTVYPSGTPKPPVDESELRTISGYVVLIIAAVVVAAGAALIAVDRGPSTAIGAVLLTLTVVGLGGLTTISPGEVRVVQVFGHYKGTVRATGLRWVNPFAQRRAVSTRIRNQESATVKVNDADGNPIEMAAVVVWQVQDSARAVYAVDDFVAFVNTQSETAIRHVANTNPYDNGGSDTLSLRDHTDEIATQLAQEIAARVAPAGVHVAEARITRLSYAPEIAQVMLQRQQAGAVVAARSRIVDGAVGMVQMALTRLAEEGIVELDEERKAAMVSNLLVVLCGDRGTQPVVNTGSLYQ